ncbi:hypothetical protein HDA40_002603 [Hamadaea flava]|uniref:DUF4386 domain-containing protein n=1 Tax=Hamadaea flava TaxID=1742688 RepID=A0ABV8LKY8_9ACTN|nr:hypothetical protein [Hamadaea flava]MCP2324096.1 hypothetical protein [Hamadaea flava]
MARPQSGPPLIAPAAAFAALTVAGIALAARTPRPDAPAAEVLGYLHEHAGSVRLSAFLLFGASVPLAIWAAAAYRRLRALGITAPGSAIALAGGVLAAGFAAISALITWTASRLGDAPDLAAALRDLAFITGGPGFTAFLGLLLAGVAVPMALLRIRRPFALAGLGLALVGELSTLAVLTLDLAVLLPVARFGGILWLLTVSLLLPASRPRTNGVPE